MSVWLVPPLPSASSMAFNPESRLLKTVTTCLGQDRDSGIGDLTWTLRNKQKEPWVKQVPLNAAVLSNSINCLRYLVDEIRVKTINDVSNDGKGYTPLQSAVIWGRLEVLVYLLSRSADPMLNSPKSIVDQARLRQQRLQKAFDEATGADFEEEGVSITSGQIAPLLEEGRDMLEILEGVEAAGSYLKWARANSSHPLVKKFYCDEDVAESRYEWLVLRELVLRERAALLSAQERASVLAQAAARAEVQAKEATSLMDTLTQQLGFDTSAAKQVAWYWKNPPLSKFRTLKVSSEEIESNLEALVRNKIIQEGERRKFTRWVRELEEGPAEPEVQVAKASAKQEAKASAKPKAKANAALLAIAAKAKPKAKGKAESGASIKKKKGDIDGLEVIFAKELPSLPFIIMSQFLFGEVPPTES